MMNNEQRKFVDTIWKLKEKGQLFEAEKIIKKAILECKEKELLSELYHILALIYLDKGECPKAISTFQEALNFDPTNPVYLTNMALALKKSGNYDSAKRVLEYVLEINPNYPYALNNLANILKEEGRFKEAKILYEKALNITSEILDIKVNYALLLLSMGEFGKAKDILLDIVKRKPNFQPARKALGAVFSYIGDFTSAEINYRYALMLNPKDSFVCSELGGLLASIDPPCIKEAESLLYKALEIDPYNAQAYHNLGFLYSIIGEKQKAFECYKKAFDLRPKSTLLLRHIAQFLEFDSDNVFLKRMEEMKKERLSKSEKMELFFALSFAYKKIDPIKSFEYLMKGNALKREILEYNPSEVENMVSLRLKVFTKEKLPKLKGYGFPSELPVFIVGMPRSGTTLMEALLDSHPDVYGAGELKLFNEVLKKGIYIDGVLFISDDKNIPQQVLKAPEGFFHIGMKYIMGLRRLAPWAKRIVDKMPGNFFYIGIIICSLPWAKIIHMRRHPLDTLLSCFEQPFTEKHEWTYRLEELAHYYNNYFRLYKHWKEVFPEEILDVDYEMLVLNFEDEMEKVLSHLGLDWHDDIREFYKKQRVVKTASMEQVRKPIYSSSIMRWKRYEKFLDPLISNLSQEVKDEIKRIEEKVRSFIEV